MARTNRSALIYVALLLIYGFFFWNDVSTGFRTYKAYPENWIGFSGMMLMIGGIFLTLLRWWIVPRLARRQPTEGIIVIAVWVSIAIAFCLITFEEQIYLRPRLAMDQTAMERYLAGQGDCPTRACKRDPSGVVAFVHGESPTAWSGICHDPARTMRAAEKAQDGKQPGDEPALVFGGEVRRAMHLDKDWVGCAVREPRPQGDAGR
jgi:hypothetical protein